MESRNSGRYTRQVRNFFAEFWQPLVGVALGLSMIVWPPPRRKGVEEKRLKRLAQLDAGADEAFLEERRELETYGPSSSGPFRLLGAIVLLLSIAAIYFGLTT